MLLKNLSSEQIMTTEKKVDVSANFATKVSYTSKINYKNYELKWTIEDFDTVCKGMKSIESRKFPSINSNQGQWYLRLEPVELKENSEENFLILLHGTYTTDRYVNLNISLFNHFGQKIEMYENFLHKSPFLGIYFELPASVLLSKLRCKKLPPKKVTVTCQLQVFDSFTDEVQKPLNDTPNFENLLDQMDKLFLDQDFKDVTFTVEEKEFQAHKLILALRSPVFAAMFKSKMNEELSSTVKIEDINSTTFEKMLRFIYTDKVENLEEFAFEMFYAAEKYQLEKLKNMCANSLYKNLSLKTVVHTLELANIFSISNLKARALKYLVLHLQEIKETLEFVKLMKDFPHLAIDIVEMMNSVNKNGETDEFSEPTVFQLREDAE